MAHLALTWSEDKNEVLKEFKLLFLIKLSEVAGKDKTLEQCIIEQHEELSGMEEELHAQLQDPEIQVLVILDGVDEYAMGTNNVIDIIINNKSNATRCRKCLVITSRGEAQNLNRIANQMGKVIVAKGFDKNKVIQCAKNFFRSAGKEEETSLFLSEDTIGLLRVPIILVMAYLLHQDGQELPTSKTEVIGNIIDLVIDRKKSRLLTEEEKKNLKIQVGEKAWDAAQKGIIVLEKVQVLLKN